MAKREGRCRLCLKNGALSKEHVPPKAAGNCGRVRTSHALDFIRDPSTETGRILQNGAWTYSLCEECNGLLGRHYVPEYVKWAKWFLHEYNIWVPGLVPVYLRDVYPLRFLKQAVSMLFSVNGDEFARGFEPISSWVRSPEARAWHWNCRVYLTLAHGNVGRGWNLVYRGGKDSAMFTEIALTPFSVQLVLEQERDDRPGDITWFARYGYNERADLCFALPCGFLASAVPAHFASPEEVERARAKARRIREDESRGDGTP